MYKFKLQSAFFIHRLEMRRRKQSFCIYIYIYILYTPELEIEKKLPIFDPGKGARAALLEGAARESKKGRTEREEHGGNIREERLGAP